MADLSTLKKKTGARKQTSAKAESINLNEISDLMDEAPIIRTPEEKEKTKDLNFKVPVSFHKAFKKYAIVHDMSMKDLLEASFEYYQDRHNAK